MKNIHVFPTDKYSDLVYSTNKYGGYFLSRYYSPMKEMGDSYQNIYITSDEYIGLSYYLDGSLVRKGVVDDKDYWEVRKDYKKIILTTDQDLIKDGVQPIPDEFLQWFVKNPSCEEVEVEIESKFDRVDGHYHDVWEIIIPSKDDLKIGDNTNFGIITDINEKSVCFGKNKVGVDVWYKKSYVVKFPNLVLEEPKQETLEEAKIKHIKFCIENNIENPSFSFDKGVKWEQEQNEILLNEYHEYTVECIEVDLKRPLPFKSWFKQNKKK